MVQLTVHWIKGIQSSRLVTGGGERTKSAFSMFMENFNAFLAVLSPKKSGTFSYHESLSVELNLSIHENCPEAEIIQEAAGKSDGKKFRIKFTDKLAARIFALHASVTVRLINRKKGS